MWLIPRKYLKKLQRRLDHAISDPIKNKVMYHVCSFLNKNESVRQ